MIEVALSYDALRAVAADARRGAVNLDVGTQALGQAMSPMAFGVLCTPLLLPTYAATLLGMAESVASTSTALTRMADGLDAATTDWQGCDDAVADMFRGFGDTL